LPVSVPVVIAATAPACPIRNAKSRAVSMVMQGIGTAPSLRQATMAICHSGIRGSMTMTRSPRATPWAPSQFATRFDRRRMSSKLKRRSAPCALHQISARRAGSAAQASTTSRPKLKRAGAASRCARQAAW
jgi:hypothetical protein